MDVMKLILVGFVSLSLFALILFLTELAYEKFIDFIFGKEVK